VPKALKDRRLRIPSTSIYNVKEQERKPTSGKKVTGCELPRARFYSPPEPLSNAKKQKAALYSNGAEKTTKPSLRGRIPGAETGPRVRASATRRRS